MMDRPVKTKTKDEEMYMCNLDTFPNSRILRLYLLVWTHGHRNRERRRRYSRLSAVIFT